MSITRRTALAASTLVLPALARAQAAWPRQSIRFIVPFAPGGTSEIVARTVAVELTRQLGQTVYVENKGGGAGLPAMQDVAKAAPDGYNIILGHVGSLAVNPVIFPNQPFDVNKDFLPVTLQDLVASARAHPGKLNVGSIAPGSTQHLSAKRFETLAGYNVASWNALAAPAGTPAEVIDKLGRVAREAVASPAVQDKLGRLGLRLQGSTAAEMQALLASEIQRWGAVTRSARIEPE